MIEEMRDLIVKQWTYNPKDYYIFMNKKSYIKYGNLLKVDILVHKGFKEFWEAGIEYIFKGIPIYADNRLEDNKVILVKIVDKVKYDIEGE